MEPVFITPSLEVPREQQWRQAPAAGRGRRNEAGGGTGGRQAWVRQRARGMAALVEEEFRVSIQFV